jgi:hypothetical protein
MAVRSSYAPAFAWDCAFPPRSYIPSFARRSCWENSKRRAKKQRLSSSAAPPPPGKADVAQPSRPGLRLGTARFFLGTRNEEAQERPLPASGGAGAAPPPKTTAPASWRLTLPWVSPGAGWWAGDRGHQKGQLRVLGSPSAHHTK